MAKLQSMFKYDGTFNGVTSVNSSTYGHHLRAARGTKSPAPVNEAMRQSSVTLKRANVYAKLIKDAFEVHRQDFKDGTFWSRLVSFFKRQLKDNGSIQWSGLKGFEFFNKHRLYHIARVGIEASATGAAQKSLRIEVTSSCLALKKQEADQYQQTLLALFLDKTGEGTLFTSTEMFPFRPEEPREQVAQWDIPPKATVVVAVVKIDLFWKGQTLGRLSRRGMSIVTSSELKALETTG